MLTVGLLGGIASGKSLVARQLAELGAGVLDADRAAHEVLRLPEVEAAARQRWGERVFGPDGWIDRGLLADLVFSDPPEGPVERKFLEKLTHPEIARVLKRQAEQLDAAGVEVAVLDAPLIFEAGWNKLCDVLVFVDAPLEARLARAKHRGWGEEELASRQRTQAPLGFKREQADWVIDNSGTPEQTRAQVERLWRSLFG